jgi:hypothetical protein
MYATIRRYEGFAGYFLIETRLAARWVRENDLASALPDTPKITAGPLIVDGRPAAPTKAVLSHA